MITIEQLFELLDQYGGCNLEVLQFILEVKAGANELLH